MLRVGRETSPAQQRGCHVDERYRPLDDGWRNSRAGQHERDAQRRVVGQHPVCPLVVLAQPFAVIAGNGDDGVTASSRERRVDACDLRVRIGHFPIVRIPARATDVLGRRGVRCVRIVKVDPDEIGRSCARQPGERRIDDVRAFAFGLEPVGRVRIASDAIVVVLEAVGQPESAIEHVGTDERAV